MPIRVKFLDQTTQFQEDHPILSHFVSLDQPKLEPLSNVEPDRPVAVVTDRIETARDLELLRETVLGRRPQRKPNGSPARYRKLPRPLSPVKELSASEEPKPLANVLEAPDHDAPPAPRQAPAPRIHPVVREFVEAYLAAARAVREGQGEAF